MTNFTLSMTSRTFLAAAKKVMLFGDFGKYYVRKVGGPVIGVMRERFWPALGIAGLIRTEGVHALQYQGKRYDCGSKEGFLEATVELALRHPEVGPGFQEYLKGVRLRG